MDASGCKGIFDPTSPELFSPHDMSSHIQELCGRNHSEIPLTIGDFGKVINRSLAECYYQAATRQHRQAGELIVTGGGINNAPLMKELSTRFSIRKGSCEATALGNIRAQIAALS